MQNLKVLDVRFNLITQEEREVLKNAGKEHIQMFV